MADVNHSTISVASVHPINGVATFANASARTAHVYSSTDEFKVVRQTDDDSAWLITDVTAGVATFRKWAVGLSDLAGATQEVWMPDVAPSSAHAKDDEFSAGSLDPKWVEWDPGANTTVSIDTVRKAVKLSQIGAGAISFGGIRQAVPSGGEFAIYARLGLTVPLGGLLAALFVSGDIATNPGTAAFRVLGFNSAGSAAAGEVYTATWSNYAGAESDKTNPTNWRPQFFRMRVNGTTVYSDISNDGWIWQNLAVTTVGFGAPTHMGLCLSAYLAGPSVGNVYAPFFRCLSGAGTSAEDVPMPGRLVQVVPA